MENNEVSHSVSPEDAERIADSLAAALENRRQRADRAVIHSFAQQNHLTPETLEEFLRRREEKRGDSLPADWQAVIDSRLKAADERLIAAEIRCVGSRLGLVDPDAAALLMDRSGVFVDDNGDVHGVRDSLELLLKNKPYLAAALPASTGRAGNFPRADSDAAGFAARLARMYASRASSGTQ